MINEILEYHEVIMRGTGEDPHWCDDPTFITYTEQLVYAINVIASKDKEALTVLILSNKQCCHFYGNGWLSINDAIAEYFGNTFGVRINVVRDIVSTNYLTPENRLASVSKKPLPDFDVYIISDGTGANIVTGPIF